jgi:hypothetical protein
MKTEWLIPLPAENYVCLSFFDGMLGYADSQSLPAIVRILNG